MTERRLPLITTAILLIPAIAQGWMGDRIVAPGRPLPGGAGMPAPGFAGKRAAPRFQPPDVPIAPPHPSGASVIELLEDDAGRMARILGAGDDPAKLGKSGAWGEDCFSGVCCLKVAGYQCYRSNIPGWGFPVVEKPRAGEYRYLRFAWKRPEGNGIMVQLSLSGGMDWGRYFAGQNTVGFYPALQIGTKPPREWEVVTRDLFADFGGVPFNLTGFAFTSMDGVALFDHVYLGRTIEDLDKVTEAAKQWRGKTGVIGRAQLEEHWKNLACEDAAVRQPSLWALGACGASSLPQVKKQLKIPDPTETERKVNQAIGELDAARFATREKAFKDLEEFGTTAQPLLEAALKDGISSEMRARLEKLIAKCQGEETVLTSSQRIAMRLIRILEQSELPESKTLLEVLSKANLEAGLSLDAKAAVERLEKRKK
jgi:hypothetical protein